MNNKNDKRKEQDLAVLDLEDYMEVLPAMPERRLSRVIPPDPVKKTKKVAWFAVVVSLVAVFFSVTAFIIVQSVIKEKEEFEAVPEPQTTTSMDVPDPGHYISYGGQRVPVLEDVATNDYDPRGFYTDQNGFTRYEVDGQRAHLGIDVSAYQNDVDWAQVAAAGIEFAIVRVAARGYGQEGNLGMDSRHVENIIGATQNDIDVGVYFFSQALNIIELDEEISMLLSLIENYHITYPVVFDWEYITTAENARSNDMTGEELTKLAKHFCEKIQLAGYTPAVYFNMDMGYLYYDLSELDEYPFWLAELQSYPRFYYHFDIWQNSFTGTVPGITGPVDMNLSFRNFAAE